MEVFQHLAAFMEPEDALVLSITCRWFAAVLQKQVDTSIDTRWALRRRWFAERWKEIADNERIHVPSGQTMLYYRCLSAHLSREFSIQERGRSAHVRWCLWGPEKRTMFRRSTVLVQKFWLPSPNTQPARRNTSTSTPHNNAAPSSIRYRT